MPTEDVLGFVGVKSVWAHLADGIALVARQRRVVSPHTRNNAAFSLASVGYELWNLVQIWWPRSDQQDYARGWLDVPSLPP